MVTSILKIGFREGVGGGVILTIVTTPVDIDAAAIGAGELG